MTESEPSTPVYAGGRELVRDFPSLFPGLPEGDEWMVRFPQGWRSLVRRLCADLAPLPKPESFSVRYVKAKFAELRFVVDDGTAETRTRIEKAMDESRRTCERCGSPGRMVVVNRPGEPMWYEIACPKHTAEGARLARDDVYPPEPSTGRPSDRPEPRKRPAGHS